MTISSLGFSEELPIFDRQQDILDSVDANQVTIITAETGAGKSTQVPQYLAEHGYQKIIITQPRILAARNLSLRVSEEVAERTGKFVDHFVGYRTAHERDDSPETVILYCTDGLQLVREITGSGTLDRQVLVLDEIHEWNENMEVLVAWAKKRCQEDPRFKVVLMSATIEADTLAAYFDAVAPIAVKGRSFEVTKRRGKDVISEIFEQLEVKSSNMLVFLPGKAEIENVTEVIANKAASKQVPVIILHGQLEASAQQLAFASHPQGKIILTTNIAQTSVTIDDIDLVIDSGLERRSEVQNGVEGLFLAQISQADCLQRAGRAGRTKAGEYILAPLDNMPCWPFEDRPAYGTPEILRKHIDRLTLRLANVGIDVEQLDFYHAPSKQTIKLAKRTLVTLGALTHLGEITAIGRQMERFPVESSYARMLVEAEQYEKPLQTKLAAIIAIQEVGGIVKSSVRYNGWRRFTRQNQSDLLAQYDVYLALPDILEDAYEELGIIGKNVSKATEVMERLERDLGLDPIHQTAVEDSEKEQLMQSIVAGQIDQLWVAEDDHVMHIVSKKKRELSSGTVVEHPKLVAGTPFDLQIPLPQGGLETLHLVQNVTTVEPAWLEALAPQLFKVQAGKVYFEPRFGSLAVKQLVKFNGQVYEAVSKPILDNNSYHRRLFAELYGGWLHERLEKERQQMQNGHGKRLQMVPLRQVQDQVRAIADGETQLENMSSQQRTQLARLAKMQTYFSEESMRQLEAQQGRSNGGHRIHTGHRKWQPQHKRKYDRRRDSR